MTCVSLRQIFSVFHFLLLFAILEVIENSNKPMPMKYFLLFFLLTGCNLLSSEEVNPTRPAILLPSQTPALNETPNPAIPLPERLFDALPVMQGICFETAWDAAGQVFIMRTAEEHIHFYGLVDNSRLCRRAVERLPFDFSTGNVLAGLWNRGYGCTASHSINEYLRDEAAQTIRLNISFQTQGDCPYELVRGFWLGFINAKDYQISIEWSEQAIQGQ